MPKFPIVPGTFKLPDGPIAQLGSLVLTNTNNNNPATVTVTEVATGRVVFTCALDKKGSASLSGLNITDLIPGGQYNVDVVGNVQGTISTDH